MTSWGEREWRGNIRIYVNLCEVVLLPARLALDARRAKTVLVIGILLSAAPRVLFAHQFGWDEILLFLVPIVLALAGVRWFEKRSSDKSSGDTRDDGNPSD
jgi:hypothetical protein